jgi:hypothetical protein
MLFSRQLIHQRSVVMLASAIMICVLSGGRMLADQIINGNFSAGDTGFTSGYTLVPANGTVQTWAG